MRIPSVGLVRAIALLSFNTFPPRQMLEKYANAHPLEDCNATFFSYDPSEEWNNYSTLMGIHMVKLIKKKCRMQVGFGNCFF